MIYMLANLEWTLVGFPDIDHNCHSSIFVPENMTVCQCLSRPALGFEPDDGFPGRRQRNGIPPFSSRIIQVLTRTLRTAIACKINDLEVIPVQVKRMVRS